MKTYLGIQLKQAVERASKVSLHVVIHERNEHELECDHVIAVTDYRADLERLPFMFVVALASVRTVEPTLELFSRFGNSLRGLFFSNSLSANVFGPLMRFSCGNRIAARRSAPYVA